MIILASASPRRQELLSRITLDFQVISSDVSEETDSGDPREVVSELAGRKAEAVSRLHPSDVVIGCDTVVYAGGEILGKPQDRRDAERMMRLLAGRDHRVCTGVDIRRGTERRLGVDYTRVSFTEISEEELAWYLDHADYMDKAGAYAIQGEASRFIRCIDGSPSGVMGLPIELTYHMLKQFEGAVL
ncbi:MAG: septum formation protein Maf [Clostridia bacterium]|nr:septum formation protein Maf [Clostridia bacterium]